MFRGVLVGFLLCINFVSFGQEIKPNALFGADTIKIGETVPYSVWIAYPKEFDVLFPDSLYDFSPFELDHKTYYLTESDSLTSRDSVVYHLTTFEIDTVQRLTVPIYLVDEFDSTELFTPLDSIILQHVVTEIPDSVALIINTEYTKVPLQFNYPYLIIGIVIGIVIIIIVFLVFGKTMKKQIVLFRIRRKHNKFIKKFDQLLSQEQIEVEPTLALWKGYVEWLTKQPYTKLTTTDISSLVDDEPLMDALHAIDRVIYANVSNEEVQVPFTTLRAFAIEAFMNKNEEVKNG